MAMMDNTELRYDTTGQVVDAHDGCLEQFGDHFYLYGTAYGGTTGFTQANEYRCYSSPDLVHWTNGGPLLPSCPAGVYYRPYVKHCSATGKYVLWYNWYATLWEGQLGVAVSDSPTGPFEIVNAHVKVAYGHPGDMGLLVDEDGTGYLIYTSIAEAHAISVERLAPDFLSSTGSSSGLIARGDEACALFRRGDWYYAVFDTCCCFCPEGSGAKVYRARNPLGVYEYRGNINRVPENCQKGNGIPIISAQQTHIAVLSDPNDGIVHVWMGDRWGSTPDGIKGHDFQFWSAPLRFTADGDIEPLSWVERWPWPAA